MSAKAITNRNISGGILIGRRPNELMGGPIRDIRLRRFWRRLRLIGIPIRGGRRRSGRDCQGRFRSIRSRIN